MPGSFALIIYVAETGIVLCAMCCISCTYTTHIYDEWGKLLWKLWRRQTIVYQIEFILWAEFIMKSWTIHNKKKYEITWKRGILARNGSCKVPNEVTSTIKIQFEKLLQYRYTCIYKISKICLNINRRNQKKKISLMYYISHTCAARYITKKNLYGK